MKQDWYESNIYVKIFQYTYYFLTLNVYFVMTIFPFFILTLLMELNMENLIIFSLFSLTLGPSIKAIMGSLNHMVETKELVTFKTYFAFFKRNFSESLLLWFFYTMIIFIVVSDMYFFVENNTFILLIPLFIIILVLTTGFTLNCYYFRLLNQPHNFLLIAKISFYCSLKKFFYTILNSVLLFSLIVFIFLKPQFGFFITPSLFIYLILKNCKLLYPKKGD